MAMYESGWRAEVARDFRHFGLAAYIWRKYDSGDVDLVLPIEPTIQRIAAGASELEFRDPSLRFDPDMAHAVLDGLAAYFGGTSDVQRLNRDLALERARTDKLTDAVIAIATRPNHG